MYLGVAVLLGLLIGVLLHVIFTLMTSTLHVEVGATRKMRKRITNPMNKTRPKPKSTNKDDGRS